MGRKKVFNKKVSFAAAIRKSLVRNIKIQAKLQGISSSQLVEKFLSEAAHTNYNFVHDDKIFNLPLLEGKVIKVMSIWVSQLGKSELVFDEGQLSYRGRSLKIEDLDDEVDGEKNLFLKETLYNFLYPDGLENAGLLSIDEVKIAVKECGIEGFFEVIDEPHRQFLFIVPDRKCNLKRVVEIERKMSIDKVYEVIKMSKE
ncbi:MAG: hypothetical protein KAU20_05605 [Nanoarchaeota archaeon]|nr:hypothetical protein [Nanoarchaeota archaeon]